MASHTIRTTIRPDVEITVDEAEYQQLLAYGLIYDGTPPVAPADFYDEILTDKAQDSSSAFSAALRAAYVSHGTTDPGPTLAKGTEYVWMKTDGAGTLLDILAGVS